MTRVYVALGANLGPREVTIQRAVTLLGEEPGIELLEQSSLRETEPIGVVDQPMFLNGVVSIETSLSPRALLDALLRIERELGRTREGERWGPRTIDLDLLLYGDETIDEPGLTVPHPRLAERDFVLEPLHELDPELALPDGRRITELWRG